MSYVSFLAISLHMIIKKIKYLSYEIEEFPLQGLFDLNYIAFSSILILFHISTKNFLWEQRYNMNSTLIFVHGVLS